MDQTAENNNGSHANEPLTAAITMRPPVAAAAATATDGATAEGSISRHGHDEDSDKSPQRQSPQMIMIRPHHSQDAVDASAGRGTHNVVASATTVTSSAPGTNDGRTGLSTTASAFTTVSSPAPGSHISNNTVGNLSSSSESEHLTTTTTNLSTSAVTVAPSPSLSSSAIAPMNSRSSHSNSMATAAANAALDNNNNNSRSSSSLPRLHSTKTTTPKSSHYKTPATPSHSCMIASRPSSLSSKSRGSQSSSRTLNKPHAYFASSEEESEAELDEKDSHSSRASNNNYGHHASSHHHQSQQRHGGLGGNSGVKGKSSLRGSRKLAEIASQVDSRVLHSSRVRMTIPLNHHDSTKPMASSSSPAGGLRKESISSSGGNSGGGGGINKPIIASIYKTASSNRDIGAVPPPPQTVTVAVGKNSGTDAGAVSGASAILPAGASSSMPRGGPSSSLVTSSTPSRNGRTASLSVAGGAVPVAGIGGNALPAYTSTPVRKRIRKKRRHKHLPRGLPVFKDPRSCMWTSTHDANAPSEDRYSSLVNVLLRPPKTPRGKKIKKKDNSEGKKGSSNGNGNNNGNNNNNGNGNNDDKNGNNNEGAGGGSKSGSSCDGSYSGEEDENEQQGSQTTLPHNNATAGGTANDNENTPNSNNNEDDEDNTSLIRLSLWSVIDGHGGGCVATYAAEVLLPHIAASVARALKSEIVDRGVCNVNGQLRDANALDLDGLIRSSDRSRHVGKSQVRQREAGIDVVNPNSIHYRSPYEDSESEGDVGVDRHGDHFDDHDDEETAHHHPHRSHGVDPGMRSESESEAESEAPVSVASSLLPGNPITHGESVSSVKTSVKTAVSPVTQHAPVGTHSPAEVASITRAITDSFLAVDEGWINSIDPVTTHQTSCVSNGRWNAGACALVVFIVQRLDWCRSSRVDHETHHTKKGARGFEDTSHNKDAARRRKLDYATKSKSVSSLSTLSSTSSITTEANTTESMLVEESEITETEDDDDVSDIFGPRRRRRKKGGGHHHHHHHHDIDDPHHQEGVFIATPAGCKCHYYRPHDAMLYTAHVGDCRAVMLGSAPPRTIKVPPGGDSNLSLDHADTSEDESSSVSIADEISSSEHDSDSSGDMLEDEDRYLRAGGGSGRGGARGSSAAGSGAGGMLGYARRAAKRQRRNEKAVIEQPFVPLPPLNRRDSSSEESAVESDDSTSTTAQEHMPPVGSIVRTVQPARGVVVGRSVVTTGDTRTGGVVVTGPVVDVDPRVDPRVVVAGRPVVFNNLEEEKLLETEDEEAEDEIKEIRSVRSGSPTQMDRPPSPTQLVADPVHPPPLPLSMLMRPIDLTTDHSAYNPAEVTAVLRRCNNAPKAISSASGGGIKRVAGSLAVTRALGDAYLKTPRLSFFPYKRHAPYITARPEVNCRVLTKGADRILTLASDGVWERASGDDVLRWVRNYYNARIAGVKEQHLHGMYDMEEQIQHEHHDPFGDMEEKALSRSSRKHGSTSRLVVTEGKTLGGGSTSGNELASNATAADADGGGSSGEISSEDGRTSFQGKAVTTLKSLPAVDDATKKPTEGVAVGSATPRGNDDKVEDSDAATTSEATATTTTADETSATTATTTKSGTKRKHPSGASAGIAESVSSRGSGSTESSTRGGLLRGPTAMTSSTRRHLRSSSSSRPYSLSIPTVSEVIVRKVLNKVRKTRNISSLRMLMSLPKGRARRSKHDDITATVVDLSGFVS